MSEFCEKRFLFYFVHPAKFHLARITINTLKSQGYDVDIIITGRDILEELVLNEGWEYTKIFPKGRKIKGIHVWISASIYIILTLLKLFLITFNKKYDFFITDDLLTFIGRFKGIPSIFVTDDDLSAVPESFILMTTSNYILAPDICDLGKYNKKKLGYFGYKALFHLHPNHFTPNRDKIPADLVPKSYFFIRTVSPTSTHDVGKKGISNEALRRIILKLEPNGKVVLNSERELPKDLRKYLVDFRKNDIAHLIYFSKIFISDSTTMCAEAAVLGVPAIEFDDWFDDFKQYKELNEEYGLLHGFAVEEESKMLSYLNLLLFDDSLIQKFEIKRERMLNNKIDTTAFLLWILTKYPKSVAQFFRDKEIQSIFK